MIQLDKFTAEWLKDLTEAVQALISREMFRIQSISTVRTPGEVAAMARLEIAFEKLSKYKVEEAKDG